MSQMGNFKNELASQKYRAENMHQASPPHYLYEILNCSVCGKLIAQTKTEYSGELDLHDLQTEEAKQLQKLYYESARNLTHPQCMTMDYIDRANFFAEWLKQRISLMKDSGLEKALALFEKEYQS